MICPNTTIQFDKDRNIISTEETKIKLFGTTENDDKSIKQKGKSFYL